MDNKEIIEPLLEEQKETKKLIQEIVEILENNKKDLLAIQKNVNEYTPILEKLRQKETLLDKKIFSIQKENIKDNLNKSIGGIFGNVTEILKNTSNEIKKTLEKNGIDKSTIEAQYEKYKTICIKKGEQIKNLEEFSKITNFLHKTSKNFNFDDFIHKVNLEKSEEPTQSEQTNKPQTKQDILKEWVRKEKITDFNAQLAKEKHNDYLAYLNTIFVGEPPSQMIYSLNGNSFLNATRKIINEEKLNK